MHRPIYAEYEGECYFDVNGVTYKQFRELESSGNPDGKLINIPSKLVGIPLNKDDVVQITIQNTTLRRNT